MSTRFSAKVSEVVKIKKGGDDGPPRPPQDPMCKPIFILKDGGKKGLSPKRMKVQNVYDKIITYNNEQTLLRAEAKTETMFVTEGLPTPIVVKPSLLGSTTLWECNVKPRFGNKPTRIYTLDPGRTNVVSGSLEVKNAQGEKLQAELLEDQYGVLYIKKVGGDGDWGKVKFQCVTGKPEETFWKSYQNCPDYTLSPVGVVEAGIMEMDSKTKTIAGNMADYLFFPDGAYGWKNVVDTVGKYCAGWECNPIPKDGGTLVERCFYNKTGACRHRATAFVMIASYLNLRCRYVVSDCHAWVMVYNKEIDRYVMVDLGGCDPGGESRPAEVGDLDPPPDFDFPDPDDYDEDTWNDEWGDNFDTDEYESDDSLITVGEEVHFPTEGDDE